MCGKEFCNAYTELNDPFEQRLRFEEQVRCLYPFFGPEIEIVVLMSCYISRPGRRIKETMKHKASTKLSSTRTCLCTPIFSYYFLI